MGERERERERETERQREIALPVACKVKMTQNMPPSKLERF